MRLAPPLCHGTRRHGGLTLIELIVAIAVVAILFTWAIPSFQRFSARNEVAAEVMRIRTALQLAKNTAVTRRRVIAVCPIASMSATKCEKYDWSLPIAIIDGHATAGDLTGVEILKVLEPTGGPSVTFNRDYPVRFQSTGWSRGHNGTFLICHAHATGANVVISNSGRATAGHKDC
ncbi:type IV fimbrial biogenesis protein FimT [Halomonas shengliensis]|uniref:Type II secretion system protein H n=1 Tax=Halomonas shengliensis TaxID=419597 RepID=A0A1H0MRG6_9GAMM|nr:GspH/FimT family pseudopilin [Halomonas shengliensis]SDO82885.1 type IV fimbrial biogenesis protein FimT [Halomonas shengliensis]